MKEKNKGYPGPKKSRSVVSQVKGNYFLLTYLPQQGQTSYTSLVGSIISSPTLVDFSWVSTLYQNLSNYS